MGLQGSLRDTKVHAEHTPSNYTPSSVVGEPTSKVSAHLKGIDSALASAGGGTGTGTAFPGSPDDGELFWHETHEKMFVYSSTAAAWIDVSGGGNAADALVQSMVY